jgi:hypothetical protein
MTAEFAGQPVQSAADVIRLLEARHAADKIALVRDLRAQGVEEASIADAVGRFHDAWRASLATAVPQIVASMGFAQDTGGAVH